MSTYAEDNHAAYNTPIPVQDHIMDTTLTPTTCPYCDTEGFPSSIYTNRMVGICGAWWNTKGDSRPAAICGTIRVLRDELTMMQKKASDWGMVA